VAGQLATNLLPVLKEMTLIVLGKDPIGSYKATILSDGKSLSVTGTLRTGSAREIERLLDSAPAVKTMVLSSNGGRLLEGKLLATTVINRAIRLTLRTFALVRALLFFWLEASGRTPTHESVFTLHHQLQLILNGVERINS
jgi:hypothetical protein